MIVSSVMNMRAMNAYAVIQRKLPKIGLDAAIYNKRSRKYILSLIPVYLKIQSMRLQRIPGQYHKPIN